MKKPDKNTRVLMVCAVVIGLMVGLVSQAEPLYRMFCGATGFGGTTQRVSSAPKKTEDRYVNVIFDGNVDPALPWDFGPDVKSVRVKLGETRTIHYHARNNGTETVVGTAVHNVQPDKAGLYFDKIQCFCFTQQVLKPGQSVDLAVQFYVDPAMAADPQNDDVQNITLSYTFYRDKDQSKAHAMRQAHVMADGETMSNP